MNQPYAVVFTLVMSVCCPGLAQEAASDIPELQPLTHYSGTWKLEARLQGNVVLRGTGKSTFILEGRFLQQRFNLQNLEGRDVLELTFLRTWDVKTKQYRSWSFASSGDATEWTGDWNQQSRTMTWTAKQDGKTLTMTSEFRNDNREDWSLISLDEVGQQGPMIEGTSQRESEQ